MVKQSGKQFSIPFTYSLQIYTPKYLSQRNENSCSQKWLYTNVHNKCPSTYKWTNLWYIHIMRYYVEIKKQRTIDTLKKKTVQKDIQYKCLLFFPPLTSVPQSQFPKVVCTFPEIIHLFTSILYMYISTFIQIVAYYTCCSEFCFVT